MGSPVELPGSSASPKSTLSKPLVSTEVHSVALVILTTLAVIFVLDGAQMVFIPLILGLTISYALLQW